MVRIVNEIDVEASPETAFDELSDLRNEMRWSPKMRTAELLSGEPITVGSRFRAGWAGTPSMNVVYTSYERPSRWGASYASWLMVGETAAEVTPTTSGSHLTSTMDLRLRGPLRPLGAVLAKAISRDIAESMRSAKNHLEQLPAD